MSEKETKTIELIEALKKRQNTTGISVYKSDKQRWFYYYDVSGFIEDTYFNFTSRNHTIDNLDIFEIEEDTDHLAKKELKKLIKKIGL